MGEAQPYTLEMYVTPEGTIPFEGDIQQAQAYWQEYQHRRPHV
jgi:hypothetical protein